MCPQERTQGKKLRRTADHSTITIAHFMLIFPPPPHTPPLPLKKSKTRADYSSFDHASFIQEILRNTGDTS